MCDDAYIVMNASAALPRLWCLLLGRAAVERDGTSVRCIARTFRWSFRFVSDHSIAGGWRRVFGQSRRSCVEADMPADWHSPVVRERREANDRYPLQRARTVDPYADVAWSVPVDRFELDLRRSTG